MRLVNSNMAVEFIHLGKSWIDLKALDTIELFLDCPRD